MQNDEPTLVPQDGNMAVHAFTVPSALLIMSRRSHFDSVQHSRGISSHNFPFRCVLCPISLPTRTWAKMLVSFFGAWHGSLMKMLSSSGGILLDHRVNPHQHVSCRRDEARTHTMLTKAALVSCLGCSKEASQHLSYLGELCALLKCACGFRGLEKTVRCCAENCLTDSGLVLGVSVTWLCCQWEGRLRISASQRLKKRMMYHGVIIWL